MDYRDLAEILSTLRAQAVQFEQAHEAEQAQQNELWQVNVKPRLKDVIAQLSNERAAAKADLAKAEARCCCQRKGSQPPNFWQLISFEQEQSGDRKLCKAAADVS